MGFKKMILKEYWKFSYHNKHLKMNQILALDT